MLEPTFARLPSMQSLACFEAAERLGSLTRAAAELHLTQGAVSRQLIALESRLQAPLLVRHRHGLALTPAGRRLLTEVRPMLQRLQRTVADLRLHRGQGGRLHLSVASTFASHWLIPRLPAFTEANPDITLDISTRIGPVDFTRVDVDAAISFIEPPALPGHAVPLVPLRLAPCAAPALARRLRRGRGHPWLEQATLLVNVSVPDGWPRWAAAAGVGASRLVHLEERSGPRYDLLSMAHNAALAGIGVALLPDFLAAASLAEGRLVRLSPTSWSPSRSYHLSWPAQSAELPALHRLRDWLLRQAQPVR